MKIIEVIERDYGTVPKTLGYRIRNKLAKLEDQEYARSFARYIPGADKERCMKAAGR